MLGQTAKPADRLGVVWIEDAAVTGGVRVSGVTAGSPAERAGLRADDRIVRFAGREIRSDDDFFAAVSAAESPAAMTVKRPGEDEAAGIASQAFGQPAAVGYSVAGRRRRAGRGHPHARRSGLAGRAGRPDAPATASTRLPAATSPTRRRLPS